jgi:hypothetical protein
MARSFETGFSPGVARSCVVGFLCRVGSLVYIGASLGYGLAPRWMDFSLSMARSRGLGLLIPYGSLVYIGLLYTLWLALREWFPRLGWLAPVTWVSHLVMARFFIMGFSQGTAGSLHYVGFLLRAGSLESSWVSLLPWLAPTTWVSRVFWLA